MWGYVVEDGDVIEGFVLVVVVVWDYLGWLVVGIVVIFLCEYIFFEWWFVFVEEVWYYVVELLWCICGVWV